MEDVQAQIEFRSGYWYVKVKHRWNPYGNDAGSGSTLEQAMSNAQHSTYLQGRKLVLPLVIE